MVFAFLSKENAAMIPVAIFLYDLILIQGITRTSLINSIKFIILMLAIVLVVIFSSLILRQFSRI